MLPYKNPMIPRPRSPREVTHPACKPKRPAAASIRAKPLAESWRSRPWKTPRMKQEQPKIMRKTRGKHGKHMENHGKHMEKHMETPETSQNSWKFVTRMQRLMQHSCNTFRKTWKMIKTHRGETVQHNHFQHHSFSYVFMPIDKIFQCY